MNLHVTSSVWTGWYELLNFISRFFFGCSLTIVTFFTKVIGFNLFYTCNTRLLMTFHVCLEYLYIVSIFMKISQNLTQFKDILKIWTKSKMIFFKYKKLRIKVKLIKVGDQKWKWRYSWGTNREINFLYA